jgi:AcrR family transcriptional regulator
MSSRQAPKEADARQRILAAAGEVFASIGLAGARVDDIAARAGINKAMLYYHVGDKDTLYAAVLTDTIERVPLLLRKALEQVETPAEKLQCVLDTFASLRTHNPHFVPIMLREIASGGATLPDEMLVRMAGVFRMVADVLAEGTRRRVFRRTDPLLTHVSLVGVMMFLVASQPIRERLSRIAGLDHHHTVEDLAQHTGNLFLKGLETEKTAAKKKVVPRAAKRTRSKK